jgi:hypothetical protein
MPNSEIPNMRRVHIVLGFTESSLAPKSVEELTTVQYLGERVPLWQAIRSVMEDAFRTFSMVDADPERAARDIKSGYDSAIVSLGKLSGLALSNPGSSGSVLARILQLIINARRTLDLTFDVLLGRPRQRKIRDLPDEEKIFIDWAVGGLNHWEDYPQFDFVQNGQIAGVQVEHVNKFYPGVRKTDTDRETSYTEVANIFLFSRGTVERIEECAKDRLREKLAEVGFNREVVKKRR